MSTQIREMNIKDVQVVSEIYIDSWRRNYADFMSPDLLEAEISKRFSPDLQMLEAKDPDIISLVAEEDGKIVGVSSSSMDERNQAWIDRMHIAPKHQGKGISKQLITATLAKHSGLQSIALKVLENNERAISVYQRHGFSQTDRIENDASVGGANIIVMSRTLSRS